MITERYSPEKRLQIYATALNDWSCQMPNTNWGFGPYFSITLLGFTNFSNTLPELYAQIPELPEYWDPPNTYSGRQQRIQCLLEAINEVIKLIPKPIKK